MSGAIIGGSIAAVGALGGAAIASNGASNAADTQAQAAQQNEQLQAELGQEQLGYESTQYGNSLALQEPWLQSGANNLATLNYLMGQGSPDGTGGAGGLSTGSTTLSIPGVNGSVSVPTVNGLTGTADKNLGAYGSLMQAYPGGSFQAPTLQQAEQAPGYKFALEQGENAMQASAAANGSLLTGGTETALNNYAQNAAQTDYNNVYNQALENYNTNYNVWSNNQANTYNRLAAMAGMGQTTAQQLSSEGLSNANSVASILGNTGNAISQQNSNAAAATASGYVGNANAWGGALNGIGSNLSQYLMLQQLMSGQNGGTNFNGAGYATDPSGNPYSSIITG